MAAAAARLNKAWLWSEQPQAFVRAVEGGPAAVALALADPKSVAALLSRIQAAADQAAAQRAAAERAAAEKAAAERAAAERAAAERVAKRAEEVRQQIESCPFILRLRASGHRAPHPTPQQQAAEAPQLPPKLRLPPE